MFGVVWVDFLLGSDDLGFGSPKCVKLRLFGSSSDKQESSRCPAQLPGCDTKL